MQKKLLRIILWIVIGLAIMVGLYYLPPVYSRLSWRLDNLRAQIRQSIDPPDEAIFVPTIQAGLTPVATLSQPPTPIPTQTTEPAGPSPTPTFTPVPLPEKVDLSGAEYYVNQCNRWNYCGPSNLTMALNFWGWQGNRDDVAKIVKPGLDDSKLNFIQRGRTDLNVMPYEMVDFVNEQTEYRSLYRYGGNVDLLKRLVAGGYPVIIEKGYFQRDTTGTHSWMGHYAYITGYDDIEDIFVWQDVYIPLEDCDGGASQRGADQQMSYADFIEGWRGFNYIFVVVYPADKEEEVANLLGDWNGPAWANQHALEIANTEIQTLDGLNLYYAWFNKGTSHVQLFEYVDAANAFDYAFQTYPGIPEEKRPWRMVWYQTSPYWAYYYTGRYADVINLADITLSTPSTGPTLEESLYWRAMAEYAIGDFVSAFTDMREAVRLNPNFDPGLFQLQQWGG